MGPISIVNGPMEGSMFPFRTHEAAAIGTPNDHSESSHNYVPEKDPRPRGS
jgi:hypothetical protein